MKCSFFAQQESHRAPTRPRPGLVARGEVEQDLVELVISSQTQPPEIRPAGLPPVRRAFLDPAVSLQSNAAEQTVPSSDVETQARIQQTGSKMKSLVSTLFYGLAYAICIFIYLMAAFIIGVCSCFLITPLFSYCI